MQQTTIAHALFQPQELTALFAPTATELTLSPEGLYYLGVVRQPAVESAA